MKQSFEGHIYPGGVGLPPEARTGFFAPHILSCLQGASDTPFSVVVHPSYQCFEYRMKLNIFTFSRLRLCLPVTVVGLPISFSKCGYTGDVNVLIRDYQRRRGLFLVLNLDTPCTEPSVGKGETLGTCLLRQSFTSLEEYLCTLRSAYRRRLNTARKKAEALVWRELAPEDFSEPLYRLYRQVVDRTDYPLEVLKLSFFQRFPARIHVLYEQQLPVAFVQTQTQGDTLSFLFGGMDYQKRDRYDLYYNMLLQILRLGIDAHAATVDYGQTAERSKMRVGCTLHPKYMAVFCHMPFFNRILKRVMGFFSYRARIDPVNPFKTIV